MVIGTYDYLYDVGLLYSIFALGSFIPSLAVMVRRLHDTNRRGWWALIIFVPILGVIALLVLLCLDGTKGPNRFGPDPKTETVEDLQPA
jgi:uncharacterized membrane protein YhaH (DUF805 family)